MNSANLLQLCRRLLDTDAVPVTWHQGHADTQVLRATTAEHGEVIVKPHRSQERHMQEIHAYRRWFPALGDRAPRLLATADDPPAIVITAVPGVPLTQRTLDPEAEQDAYRQAGLLLKTLHAAGPPRPKPDWTAWLAQRAEYWIHQAGDHITPDARTEVRAHMRALQDLAPLPTVPCHLDFMPRNMIYGDDGVVRLIDFEHSRYDLPARDLVRVATRIWALRPDLRDSFLGEYGELSTADHEALEHCTYLDTLTTLCRSGTDDPRSAAPIGARASVCRPPSQRSPPSARPAATRPE